MHNKFWRHTFLGLTATALLLTTAHAQKTPTSETIPMTKPALVDRDPFVNQISSPLLVSRQTHLGKHQGPFTNPHQALTPQPTPEPQVAADIAAVEPVEIDTSGLQVTGIIGLGQDRKAILSDGTDTKIIQVGQKLSDFRVASIGDDFVLLSRAGQEFRVPLDSEF